MGRELGIHRIDFMKDGTAVVRSSDYNLCGRTDFTGKIAQLFCNFKDKEICYLLIDDRSESMDESHETDDIRTVHVEVEDHNWIDNDFDMDYAFVDRNVIQDIVNEHMDEDNKLLGMMYDKLEDARVARQHSATLEVFEDFSDLINGLNSYISNFDKEAENYIDEILKIEDDIARTRWSHSADAIAKSYVLLTYSE